MTTDFIDVIDLGDATKETRQLYPRPVYLDSLYYLGILPDIG